MAGVFIAAYALHVTPGRGAAASYSLLTGLALGIVFQRGRFCFFCIFQDLFERRNAAPLFAILTALALGGVCYAIVFGAFLPNPLAGRLPPDAHIGPVSWALALAGFAFGVGMSLSGACISALLYRLGEGYARAPFGLLGTLVGFGLGFLSWRSLYLGVISGAPVLWLPAQLGYGGALAMHLIVLAGLAAALLRFVPPLPERPPTTLNRHYLYQQVFRQRWNPLVTGALVAIIGAFAYLRVEPLGVTAQLGSVSRTLLSNAGYLGQRLPGLDTFAGCATQVVQTMTNNGLLITGLVLGALAAALMANAFKLTKLTVRNSTTALIGGVLMGWGAMIALGCTVGTLLSGMSAFAVSGWVFAVSCTLGVRLGLKLKLHRL
jgi:uncharacterized membrane protein YedE/YeeE